MKIVTIDDLSTELLYYLASPYSKYPSGPEVAFQHISKVAGSLTLKGIGVYCPISHTHPISKYGEIDPLAHEIWLPQDFKILTRCDELLVAMLPTYNKSYGIGEEIKVFQKETGKEAMFLDVKGLY